VVKKQTPDLDLSIIDKSGRISRQHARILKLTNDYYFEDTGSTHGSSLNGEKLTPYERRLLRCGDRIGLGETIIEFILEKGTDYIGG
jgi:pSer/pThr/pTyr-binding forkhead associated (FHA) protein